MTQSAKAVPESNAFNPFELSLSEKQIPRFIGNVSSWKKWTELLESRGVCPRETDYPSSATIQDMKRNPEPVQRFNNEGCQQDY